MVKNACVSGKRHEKLWYVDPSRWRARQLVELDAHDCLQSVDSDEGIQERAIQSISAKRELWKASQIYTGGAFTSIQQ
jgi:hypothetical protein